MVYENSNNVYQVVLWMDKCDPKRLSPNTVMLCVRNIFLLENNMMDIYPEAYNEIISASGSAGIVRGDLKTKGRRIYSNKKGSLSLKPGDYGKDGKGIWVVRTPNGITAMIVDHKVTEHKNGTVTVSPSLLVEYSSIKMNWQGYLEKGIWREM